MIRNQWYVVLESKEVGTHPIGVVRLGEKFVFWRDQTRKSACGSGSLPPPWSNAQRRENRKRTHPMPLPRHPI